MNLKEENEKLREILRDVSPWMIAAYSCPPQTPEAVAILQRIESSLYHQDGNEVASALQQIKVNEGLTDT